MVVAEPVGLCRTLRCSYLSDRIGHANELVTLQIYTHRTAGLDRPMAEQLSRLIEGAVEAASRADKAS